jgi:outer membrane protein TolC
VQLALEEERLLNDSLALARKQDRDIEANFRAGAATKLDSLEAAREVLSYQLQFEQKQSEVASDFKSLLALIVGPQPPNVARAGPKGVPNLQMELDFDPLERSLNEASAWAAQAPTDEQPALKSQELLKRSAERMADGEKAAIYPTLQFTASAMYQYPDQINLQAVEQNSLVVSLSMPIFEGDRTRHLAAEQSKQAAAAAFNREQARVSLDRDYATSVDALQSLRAQQKMAELDVERSAETARLYYESYRGGKINLIDVQSANNRALLSKVNAARIDAQALAQVYGLQAISGEVR